MGAASHESRPLSRETFCVSAVARWNVRTPVIRDFLNGAQDMPDAHLALITTDEVAERFPDGGLSISPSAVTCDKAWTEIKSAVLASYIGSIGVRYEWQLGGIPDEHRSQFFHYPIPVLNRFATEDDVVSGKTISAN